MAPHFCTEEMTVGLSTICSHDCLQHPFSGFSYLALLLIVAFTVSPEEPAFKCEYCRQLWNIRPVHALSLQWFSGICTAFLGQLKIHNWYSQLRQQLSPCFPPSLQIVSVSSFTTRLKNLFYSMSLLPFIQIINRIVGRLLSLFPMPLPVPIHNGTVDPTELDPAPFNFLPLFTFKWELSNFIFKLTHRAAGDGLE